MPAYEKVSLIPRCTLTIARGTLGIVCVRLKHGRIRWHTLAYGETEFYSQACLKNFVHILTYGLYAENTLGIR